MTVFGLFGFDGPASVGVLCRDELRRYVRRVVIAALAPAAVLLGAGLLLAARRFAGALADPPSLPLAVGCAAAILTVGRVSHLIVRHGLGRHDLQMPSRWVLALDSAGLVRWAAAVVWASALSLPGILASAAVVLWIPVGLPVLSLLAGIISAPRGGGRSEAAPPGAGDLDGPRSRSAAETSIRTGAGGEADEAPLAAKYVTARMARYVTPSGADVVEGTVAVEFAAGARSGAAHLAICPPLEGRPDVEVSLDDDDVEAEVKIAQALPYAVRFDVRLASVADEPLSIRLRYRLAFGGRTEDHP